jgi:hypothetical protein
MTTAQRQVSQTGMPDEQENSPAPDETGLLPPAPDPANKTDYVAWLNARATTGDVDAAALYDQAMTQYVPWSGDEELCRAAEQGDPAALRSPEVAAWLEANASALEQFAAASRIAGHGWEYNSPDGSAIEVMLPAIGNLRTLAKLSVMDGRRLAAEGRPGEAAVRCLDVIASARQAGEGMTVIENLVGVAVQSIGANALLDLQADPAAAGLDYGALADDASALGQPLRPPADALQCERACFLDMAQRLWDVDPAAQQLVFNADAFQSHFAANGGEDAELSAAAVRLDEVGYPQTVAAGKAYYDAMTEALALPYAQGAAAFREIAQSLATDDNPLVRRMMPSLGRYCFIATRGEATRRATLLVTQLNAYRQQNGAYPETLDAFGDQGYAYDPFSDAPFVYRRQGNSFVLYSVAGDAQDNGGQHDQRGETGDLVFWPRPK